MTASDLVQAPVVVTGSAGFIGSNFVRKWLSERGGDIVSVDLLTYAGNEESFFEARRNPRHQFVKGDIGDYPLVLHLLRKFRPRAIVNFVAESHVDRSIHGPEVFIQTNINGTFHLLEAARGYWEGLDNDARERFRFLHVSTDEVFGSLEPGEPAFREDTRYDPSSPYSASKAASDHLVRAWGRTYGLPYLITNCSNNYGPAQYPEKLIPLMILNALEGKALPIYGDGRNIRDWIHVEDHCTAVARVLEAGIPGQTYCIGGRSERTNLQVVRALCNALDRIKPKPTGSYQDQIVFVVDRPGHDLRYAIDGAKIERELDWTPRYNFEQGLEATIGWYLANVQWVDQIRRRGHDNWIAQNYGKRSTL